MQTNNKFFDDLAQLASGAAGAVHSVKSEMEGQFQAWMEKQLSSMDLVTREEFDVVRAMAEKARLENEHLKAEMDILKKKLAE